MLDKAGLSELLADGAESFKSVTHVRQTGDMANEPAATEIRHYRDHRPYPEPPAHLADLTGPITGTMELPSTIDWGPKRTYDMAVEEDRRVAYELVLQEAASTEELARYVDGQSLALVWRRLWLPRRVRSMWEERFPELARVA